MREKKSILTDRKLRESLLQASARAWRFTASPFMCEIECCLAPVLVQPGMVLPTRNLTSSCRPQKPGFHHECPTSGIIFETKLRRIADRGATYNCQTKPLHATGHSRTATGIFCWRGPGYWRCWLAHSSRRMALHF